MILFIDVTEKKMISGGCLLGPFENHRSNMAKILKTNFYDGQLNENNGIFQQYFSTLCERPCSIIFFIQGRPLSRESTVAYLLFVVEKKCKSKLYIFLKPYNLKIFSFVWVFQFCCIALKLHSI